MTTTATPAELFLVALQDLHAGERAWIDRLPGIIEKLSPKMKRFADAERERSTRQAQRLETIASALGETTEGASNIWLNAILDDAERDCATIDEGPLRDIAVCGAFRKGKQSERVSYETAIWLAEALDKDEFARELTQTRDEEADADAELARLQQEAIQEIS